MPSDRMEPLFCSDEEPLPPLPKCAHPDPRECDEVGGVCSWKDCPYAE